MDLVYFITWHRRRITFSIGIINYTQRTCYELDVLGRRITTLIILYFFQHITHVHILALGKYSDHLMKNKREFSLDRPIVGRSVAALILRRFAIVLESSDIEIESKSRSRTGTGERGRRPTHEPDMVTIRISTDLQTGTGTQAAFCNCERWTEDGAGRIQQPRRQLVERRVGSD